MLKTMDKSNNAYKTIGEVAKLLNLVDKKNGKLSTHTIRYWEKEFKQIKPKVFNGKRRYFDTYNVNLLKKIKFLLKDQGMTINGVKKILDLNKPLKLDETEKNSINIGSFKNKIKNISNLIKKIKNLK